MSKIPKVKSQKEKETKYQSQTLPVSDSVWSFKEANLSDMQAFQRKKEWSQAKTGGRPFFLLYFSQRRSPLESLILRVTE